MPFRKVSRVDPRKHVFDGTAHWRHLANMIESFVFGGNAVFLSRYFDHVFYYCNCVEMCAWDIERFSVIKITVWFMDSSPKKMQGESWLVGNVGRSCWDSVKQTLNRARSRTSVAVCRWHLLKPTRRLVSFFFCTIFLLGNWIELGKEHF